MPDSEPSYNARRPMGVHVEATIAVEVFVRDEALIRRHLLRQAEAEVERLDRVRGRGRAWFSRRPSEPGTVRLQVTVPIHPFERASDRSEFDYAD